MQEVSTQTIGRNQFKCFQCRLIFAQRDGNWFDGEDGQIHLCKGCEKQMIKKKAQPAAAMQSPYRMKFASFA